MRCLQEKDLSQTHSFFREYVACLKKVIQMLKSPI